MCGIWTLKILLILAFFGLSKADTKPGGIRKFLHFSDIHLDTYYLENGEDSNYKMCRQPGGKASKYGSYRCDSPKILVESAFKAMKKYVPNPEFILWTGDSSAHNKNLTQLNTTGVMSNLKFVVTRLHDYYPGVPVVPVLGNHDSAPKDNFPDSHNKSTQPKAYSDYITAGSFGDLLQSRSKEAEQFKECGYYVLRNTTYYNTTQTFIALNTNLYYHNKAVDPINYPEDPCGQLAWLNKTLYECKPKERVFIMAHVPPGYFEHYPTEPFFSNENYTKKYMDIITNKDNAKKIVAHFYGHTHTDSFRLFFDTDHKEPVGLAFIAPSITPLVYVRHGVNPSFRVYDYDHVNRIIMSYDQYYLPLDKFILNEDDDVDKDIDEGFRDSKELDNQDYGPEEEEETKLIKNADRRTYNSKMISKREATNQTETNEDDSSELSEASLVQDEDDENSTEVTTIANDQIEGLSQVIGGVGAPAYLNIEGWKKCLSSYTLSSGSHSQYCLPSTKLDPCNQSSWDQLQGGNTPKCPEEGVENNETVANSSTRSDETKPLVEGWMFGYNPALDYNVASLTIRNLYGVWSDMKANYSGQTFKYFMRHSFVLHDKSDALDCNETCHADIVCALTNIKEDNFKDCLMEMGVKQNPVPELPTPIKMTTTTTSTTKLITKMNLLTTEKHMETTTKSVTKSTITTTIKQTVWTKRPELGITNSKTNIENEESSDSSHVVRGVVIGLSLVALVTLGIVGLFWYQRMQRRRYCSQEFLLDSFRYDGYSQLDQPAQQIS